ncbi:GDP-fucose protein O-fucosyltransferase 1 [Exaiptasia diaphana]|uniref:GDP-fucose protein O-fucosyltransferase 1 n=1 Tax=Exaiptasia diaphana TaxID=2652724 RepID=A0A913X6J6_EXADI|nr:GDP-fucose protein O-fucosyltransferase 1 [Exaiptasia diaphana]KXJ14782.1 GDP-fucose protein O-fucosyltransferase 1 [Exaiptasia diaphana]
MWFLYLLVAVLTIVNAYGVGSEITFDENGYVLYCPCMGRYGNQADHFLGSLAFAKALNRTLALPPWRTYRNIPFTDFFQIAPLQNYHRVILLEDFLRELAPKYWPVGNRKGYCWLPPGSGADCKMKDGNPFYQFWDELGVNFDDSIVFNIGFTVEDSYVLEEWQNQFPPSLHPVIAFKGAPAPYPVKEANRKLHQYLVWSTKLLSQAKELQSTVLPNGSYVGIHLRNGVDWKNACGNVEGMHNFMASPQCLGYSHYNTVTKEICFPSEQEILKRTREVVLKTKAKSVYVATDANAMLTQLRTSLADLKVTVIHGNPSLPQIDLIILAKSDHFIGNCVSSFTAHVKRERDIHGLPSSFWGFNGHSK